MKNADIKKLDALIHDDLIFVNHLGQVFTKQMDLDAYLSGSLIIKDIKVANTDIKEYSGCAIVNIEIEMNGSYLKNNFNDKVRFVRTWKKIGDSWKIIAGCSSVLQ